MKNMTNTMKYSKNRQSTRGVALITSLLLLSLFTVMTLAMVIATTSDTLINGYYKNFRGSFYAADSGMNAARNYLIAQVRTAVPLTYSPSSGSPSLTVAPSTMISNLDDTSTGFGSYQSTLGSQAASWPGTFAVDTTGTNTWLMASGTPTNPPPTAGCTPQPDCATPGTMPPANNPSPTYVYYYPYRLTVTGRSGTNEQHTIQEDGKIALTVQVVSNVSHQQSFAGWGMFIDQFPICSGTLVPGTLTGPIFTNGSWNFGTSGNYIFSDKVGQHGSQFGYQFGQCYQSANPSYSSGGQNITPNFQNGINLGANTIPLPTDSFQQKRAVLDGRGTNLAQPTNAELHAALGDVTGAAYPTGGASSGVYLPYSNATTPTCSVAPCMSGGGIYVEGNADSVVMTASSAVVSGSTHSLQVFAIKQGGTTTTITLDLTGQTTTISNGSTTKVINDLPRDLTTSTNNGNNGNNGNGNNGNGNGNNGNGNGNGNNGNGNGNGNNGNGNGGNSSSEAALLYVNGNIAGSSGSTTTGLSGPSSGPAIQDGSAVTVTAAGGISITGSLTYKTEPVTLNTADTLVPGADHGQVFGIFTAGGNVNLAMPTSGGNLQIDASIATLQAGSSWAIVNTGNQINTLAIVGGRIQDTIQNINTITRNVFFDERFANGNFAPPFFPSTTITSSGTSSATISSSANRVSWVDKTAQ